MAYWIDQSALSISAGGSRVIPFLCDTDEDVANLPTSSSEGVKQGNDETSCKKCAKGSDCLAIQSANYYVLNSNDEWKLVGGA